MGWVVRIRWIDAAGVLLRIPRGEGEEDVDVFGIEPSSPPRRYPPLRLPRLPRLTPCP